MITPSPSQLAHPLSWDGTRARHVPCAITQLSAGQTPLAPPTPNPAIIERMSEGGRSGSQGEFGHAVPVRPAPRPRPARPDRCLRGHSLAIAGCSIGWSHFYRAETVACALCLEEGSDRATWCLVDPGENSGPQPFGLSLVVLPPAVRGGVGRIEIRLDNDPIGDIDFAACGPCRRAVLEQVRVDDAYRRLGFGRVLVAAALTRAPADLYTWSTTAMERTLAARAFWASTEFPGQLGTPDYCTDMRTAVELLP